MSESWETFSRKEYIKLQKENAELEARLELLTKCECQRNVPELCLAYSCQGCKNTVKLKLNTEVEGD